MSSAAHPSGKRMAMRNFSSRRSISVIGSVIRLRVQNNKSLACESARLLEMCIRDSLYTFGIHSAAMRFDDLFHDGQPQPRARFIRVGREFVEHLSLIHI